MSCDMSSIILYFPSLTPTIKISSKTKKKKQPPQEASLILYKWPAYDSAIYICNKISFPGKIVFSVKVLEIIAGLELTTVMEFFATTGL